MELQCRDRLCIHTRIGHQPSRCSFCSPFCYLVNVWFRVFLTLSARSSQLRLDLLTAANGIQPFQHLPNSLRM